MCRRPRVQIKSNPEDAMSEVSCGVAIAGIVLTVHVAINLSVKAGSQYDGRLSFRFVSYGIVTFVNL